MPEPEQEAQQGGGMMRNVLQSIGIFLLVQFALKQFGGIGGASPATMTPGDDVSKGSVAPGPNANVPIPAYSMRPDHIDPAVPWNPVPQAVAPIWPEPTELDILMYISPSLIMPSLKNMPEESLLIEEKGFKFGDYNEKREVNTEFPVPKEVQNNGTLFAHFYVGQSGSVLDPTAPNYDNSKAYHFYRSLTQYLPKKKVKKTRNLLASANETAEQDIEDAAPKTIASYYHSNFTISLIPDGGVQNYPVLHPGVRQYITLEQTGARDSTGQNGWYYPIVFTNTFWQLKKHMTELNSTVTTLPLNVHLNHLANWKFSIIAAMDEGLKAQAAAAASGQAAPTGGDGSEMEMFKEILLDSNSYLLGLTFFVSILHMIFEMLAFKSDVSHWRKKKDNVGTSVRTILANVFMQSIIFLYLMDNNDNTSWMILFGQGMGIAIEAWKITKAVNVRVRPTPAGSWLPYTVTFEDKHVLSETEKKTEEYDQIAFKYLYRVAVPLLIAYAIYSLMYETHKSWYSFIIATLVGSVYAYGFLMMVPSLYINYRLKSVAHMAGKAMMYKTLNTFIDDLFAFTIKMPMLHRLATLRDDVIFFVYLYQSYKYKVDHTRVNEFGQGGDEEETAKLAAKPLTSAAGASVEGEKKVEAKDAAKATGSEKVSQGRRRK
ncbi:cleft lip and palate transmembrane 1 [Mytilinidion resinicola]|uniref:Cleft lip and palate transmembrane 1 n=1 Tax=Mytilinidion resinicola TaxID=574789 RepID=A0A6A6YPL1_9PEZI|nr:cleft lip and palate transmembrane 1 [Mytilinidion resinicola]KAF2810691.1 cleft lip and palate transmembrane 1 [Mytilinidion resinicola]